MLLKQNISTLLKADSGRVLSPPEKHKECDYQEKEDMFLVYAIFLYYICELIDENFVYNQYVGLRHEEHFLHNVGP